MPAVQPGISAIKVERERDTLRGTVGTLVCLITSLVAGGCASQVAQYQPTQFVDGGAPVATDAAIADGNSAATSALGTTAGTAEDWTHRTYVYRGGRDPKTGLARTQL